MKIVPYQKKFEHTHIEFASRHWTKGRRKKPEYIYWKFRGNPDAEMYSFLLAVEGDKVIGQLGLVPCELSLNNRKYTAQWACDLMVDHEYRGKSVARKLYEEAHSLKDVTLGSDPSPAAFISMTRAGYKAMNGPIKMILPISVGATMRIKFPKFRGFDNLRNPLLFLLKQKRGKKANRFLPTHWNNMIGTIQTQRASCSFPCILHDQNFMKWRAESFLDYYEAPTFLKHHDGKSFVCYRFTGKALTVNEWHSDTITKTAGFLNYLVNIAVENGQKYIQILANTESEVHMLKKLGLFRFRTPTNIVYKSTADIEESLGRYDHFYYTYWDSDENI